VVLAALSACGGSAARVPAGATFQDWQADQLQKLADALAEGP
jgi:hypothetical protein